EHLVKSGVQTIVLESENQALWLNEVALSHQKKIDCLLRVQLDWEQGSSVLGGNEITPFGIGLDEWKDCEISSLSQLNIVGFHVFQWGNILDISQLEIIWTKIINELQILAKSLQVKLDILDLGGGLGIPYTENEKPILFSDVHKILVKLKKKYQLNKIWMELGRYIVGECGTYFTKIIDKKNSRGKDILVCEGGINHIARVALVNQAFPANSFKLSQQKTKPYQVHGPLCTALDNLGTFDLPQDIEIGDWIQFHQTGAYGFTESMPFFLCHGLAGEVVYFGGDLMIPRPPKNSFDWMI
ncbi:MAG: PLP-dependent decarboxylase, partial [Halobacteriovoraceae bacterium]|nr:PLP-dependent decarboxylase [Halobacteriovoraceae bacterium]